MGFFNGDLDKSFSDKNHTGQPSIYFNVRCSIYHDINNLLANAGRVTRGLTDKGMYILISPYSKDEINKFAAEGSFSTTIQKAIDYRSALEHRDKISISQNSVDDSRAENVIPEVINNNFIEKHNRVCAVEKTNVAKHSLN